MHCVMCCVMMVLSNLLKSEWTTLVNNIPMFVHNHKCLNPFYFYGQNSEREAFQTKKQGNLGLGPNRGEGGVIKTKQAEAELGQAQFQLS